MAAVIEQEIGENIGLCTDFRQVIVIEVGFLKFTQVIAFRKVQLLQKILFTWQRLKLEKQVNCQQKVTVTIQDPHRCVNYVIKACNPD
jgi:hypothetical protein